MRTNSLVVKCVLCVSLVTLSTVALAADGKRYIGAFCTFANDDNSGQDRSAPRFGNASGSTRAVICPIVQDIIDGDIESAYIAADATMDEDTCLLWYRGDDASTGTWTHDTVASAGGGMNRTTWFPGSAWANPPANASFAIVCDLQNNESVVDYYLDDR